MTKQTIRQRKMRVIHPGTRVRLKVRSFGGGSGIGTLLSRVIGDSFAQVMCDSGPVSCLGSELIILKDQSPGPKPMRYRLPYGKWTCADGREVLFNRDYKPIWSREPDQKATEADAHEWIKFVKQEWFYDDGCPPWYKTRKCKLAFFRCEAVLREWGVASE